MSKFKIVICDDAAFIRTRLTRLIETHFPDMLVTGSYPDGEDVLEHLKRDSIDILITDICMENIDGLELAKHIYEKNLHTKVIIITGYQDFEYAQKALKYQTRALITKPIDTDEITQAVEKSANELYDFIAAATEESAQIINKHNQTEQFLQLFFTGKISPQDLRDNHLFSDMGKLQSDGYILNFYIPQNHQGLPVDSWDDFVLCENESFKIFSLCTSPLAASYIILVLNKSEGTREKIQGIISDTVKTVSLFNDTMCNYTLLKLSDTATLFKSQNFKSLNKYIGFILERDSVNQHQLLASIEDNFSVDEFKVALSMLLVFIAQKLPDFNLSDFGLKIKTIEEAETGKALFSEFHNVIKNLDSEKDIFSTAITSYIYDNICLKELSLEMVSKQFGYSLEHFSRKFKKQLGITFHQYLTDLRIAEAKKLLSDSSLSVIAISNKIGFRDPAYFSKVFKQKTGFSPKDWRNK
ncbi:MAG: response regulator [Clostridia bacterium]|nr:response regulator [Clostridia bacterium]